MTLHEFRQDTQAQRKAFIFGVALAVILGWLFLPSPFESAGPQGESVAQRLIPSFFTRRTARTPVVKPSPVPMAIAAATPLAPVTAAPDPFIKAVVGKFGGRETLPDRGMCGLLLEITEKDPSKKEFSVASTLGCMMLIPISDPKGDIQKIPQKFNATSATFTGTVRDGAIALRAVDNIGVSEALNGCAMQSMTLRPFAENQISVKWQEQETGPLCHGGELIAQRSGR